MKIRNSFVSNSSSSSFIVGFKQKPASIKEVKTLLFGKETEIGIDGEYTVSTMDAATVIFNDLNSSDAKISESEMIEEIKSGNIEGGPEYPYNEIQDKLSELLHKFGCGRYDLDATSPLAVKCEEIENASYKEHADKVNQFAQKKLEEFLTKLNGGVFYRLTYSDNGEGDMGVVLEHGNVFKNIPHVRISHH